MYICTNNSKCMYSTLYFLTYILQKKLVYLKTIMLCIHMHGTTLKQSWKQGSKDSHPKWLIFYGNKWLYSMTRNIQEIRSIWNQETKTHAKKKNACRLWDSPSIEKWFIKRSTHILFRSNLPPSKWFGDLFLNDFFFLWSCFLMKQNKYHDTNYVIIGCFFGVVSW